ncbi:MAG: cobalamin-binding protein [Bacteroidota bacterium]
MQYTPQRIICLTEETTETLYLLGEQDRIVGISVFTVRPSQARKEKPRVSAFLDAKIEKILDLKPDLVIGFSDIQANIAKELIAQGITVWVNNYRSVEGIFKMIVQLGALVNQKEKALHLVEGFQAEITRIQAITSTWKVKPRVYFEEWFDPLITGIQWVSEIVELAGGIDIFPEHKNAYLAKDRILQNPQTVVKRDPDIILASWCGKAFRKEKLMDRDAWTSIKAVRNDEVHEIKSEIILQPGPAALMDGLPMIHEIFRKWVERRMSSS